MGILHRIYARSAPDVWHTETRLLHALAMTRPPVAVQWLVTAACDLHCPHCYSAAGRRLRGELTTDEAKRLLIDELVRLGRPMLVLAGGELLLRRDIDELIAYAAERGLSWAMHTHGAHVPRHEAILRRHPPALAAISLDGDRSFHDAFRGKDGSFDAAIAAARILSDAGCEDVVLGTTITADNADRVADMLPIVAASGADSWGLHLFAPEGRGHRHTELVPSPAQLRRVAAFARRVRVRFPVELCNEWGSAGADDLYYRGQPFVCGAGRISFVVSATGDVLPCTTTDAAESEGNIRRRPLQEIWAGGFGRFRARGHGDATERGECWLQTRNGVRTATDAFGGAAAQDKLWIDTLPDVPVRRIAAGVPGRGRIGGRTSGRIAGRRTAQAVRLAAAGLVFLQACTKRGAPEGDAASRPDGAASTPSATRPPTSTQGATTPEWTPAMAYVPVGFPMLLADHLDVHYMTIGGRSPWRGFVGGAVECAKDRGACEMLGRRAPAVASMSVTEGRAETAEPVLAAHETRLHAGTPDGLTDLVGLLDAAESLPVYDPVWAAHLWRRAVALQPARVDPDFSRARLVLFGRLFQHHRVIEALRRGEAIAGKVELTPWRSKAAPRPSASEIVVPPDLRKAVRDAHPSGGAGLWQDFGLRVTVRSAEADVVLARGGDLRTLHDGDAIVLNRLDLVRSPGTFALHTDDGIVLPVAAGDEVLLWDLPSRLPVAARKRIAADVEAAVGGDADALSRVESSLPLAHPAIRTALARNPDAPGAPGLRTVLVQMDE